MYLGKIKQRYAVHRKYIVENDIIYEGKENVDDPLFIGKL